MPGSRKLAVTAGTIEPLKSVANHKTAKKRGKIRTRCEKHRNIALPSAVCNNMNEAIGWFCIWLVLTQNLRCVWFYSVHSKIKMQNVTSHALTFCLTGAFPILVDWRLVEWDLQGEGRVGRDLNHSSR